MMGTDLSPQIKERSNFISPSGLEESWLKFLAKFPGIAKKLKTSMKRS